MKDVLLIEYKEEFLYCLMDWYVIEIYKFEDCFEVVILIEVE